MEVEPSLNVVSCPCMLQCSMCCLYGSYRLISFNMHWLLVGITNFYLSLSVVIFYTAFFEFCWLLHFSNYADNHKCQTRQWHIATFYFICYTEIPYHVAVKISNWYVEFKYHLLALWKLLITFEQEDIQSSFNVCAQPMKDGVAL